MARAISTISIHVLFVRRSLELSLGILKPHVWVSQAPRLGLSNPTFEELKTNFANTKTSFANVIYTIDRTFNVLVLVFSCISTYVQLITIHYVDSHELTSKMLFYLNVT